MRLRMIIAFCLAVVCAGLRGQSSPPVVMIFPPVMPELVAHDPIGRQAAIALRQALEESGAAEPLLYNPESQMVKRALNEHKLSESELKRITSAAQALKIAAATDVPYILYGSILAYTPPAKKKDGILTISMAMVEVETQKSHRFAFESTFTGKTNLLPYFTEPARKTVKEVAPILQKMAADRRKAREEEKARLEAKKAELEAKNPPLAPTDQGSPAAPAQPSRERGDLKESQRHMSLGDTYQSRGDLGPAILEYRMAVSLYPWNSEAREKLIRAYDRKSLKALAAEEAARALQFDPSNSKLAKMAISFYLQSGEFSQAEESLRNLLNANPKESDLKIALGDVYWNQGKLEEAQKQYEQVIESDPPSAAGHERMAKLLAARGQYAESLTHLTASQQGSGTDPYQAGSKIIDSETAMLLAQAEGLNEGLTTLTVARPDALKQGKALRARAEGIGKFLQGLTPPAEKAAQHRQRKFALSLLLQAVDLLNRSLTDDRTEDREQAILLFKEAKTEMKSIK
ncbi:MAG: tetratricopeptide repeat protein [Armatimonadetes bacterium]|nr:tetratricopeptide repeat protein [Armatimonadota bacterium]